MGKTTSAITTESFVGTSTFLNGMDAVNKPEVHDMLVKKFGQQGIFMDFNFIKDRMKPLTHPKMYWAEEDRLHIPITINANVAAPGAGTAGTYTLASGDHTDSGTKSMPRLNDSVMFANGVQGVITAKSTASPGAHTITVLPITSTEDIGAVLAGDKAIVYGNAFAEGTGQPDALINLPLTYWMQTQIFKETYAITGSQATNAAWYSVGEGEKKSWGVKGELDTFKRFQNKIELTMLLQKGNVTRTVNGNSVRYTHGLFPLIRENGYNGVASTFDLASFQAFIRHCDQQGSMTDFLWYNSVDFQFMIDTMFPTNAKNDEFLYSPFESKEMAVKYGFQALKWNNYNFYFKKFKPFTTPGQMGDATTQLGVNKFANMSFIVPAGTSNFMDGNGAKMNDFSLSIRYKALDGLSRKYTTWFDGAGEMSPTKIGDLDLTKMYHRCEMGFCGMGMNNFGIFEN